MASRVGLKEFDWLIVVAVLLITVVGVTFIWSTSQTPEGSSRYVKRQALWLGISMVVGAAILSFSYVRLGNYAYFIYAVGIICLIVVLFSAPRRHTTRWIHIWHFTIQPSEFVRLCMVIAIAQFLRYRNAGRFGTLMFGAPLVLVPAVLVLKQPDLGTALTLVPIAAAMFFVAGMRAKHAAAVALAGMLCLPAGWLVMKDYQKARIWAFVSPEERKLDEGFQIIQSVIATGSGGMFGKGLAKGATRVPESKTDFIFAAVGEEWGFAGSTFLLILFVMLFASSLGIAARTREPFGRLLVVGCTASIAVQALINSGMTMQLMPITGLTLPMVSYGGSSLMASYAAVALILNVGMRRVDVFAEGR